TPPEVHSLQLEDQKIQVLDLGSLRLDQRSERIHVERIEIGKIPAAPALARPVHTATMSRASYSNVTVRKHFRERCSIPRPRAPPFVRVCASRCLPAASTVAHGSAIRRRFRPAAR